MLLKSCDSLKVCIKVADFYRGYNIFRILSYYKTEHPDRFPGVLSNICTLFDKQERIVLKNMKSFLKENGRQSNSSSMVSDFNAHEITVERLEIGTQTTRIKTASASTEMIPVSLTTIGVQIEPETMSQEIETEIEEGEKNSTEIVPAADLTSFAPVQNSPTLQSVNYSIVEQLASAHKKHAENTQILAKLFQSCLNQGTSEPGQKNQ
uniref:Uncharacterized protein n=2 Tax=Caenorhabditis japonica TaxID=281687 RepID=A0A8R1IPU7_CAEJA